MRKDSLQGVLDDWARNAIARLAELGRLRWFGEMHARN